MFSFFLVLSLSLSCQCEGWSSLAGESNPEPFHSGSAELSGPLPSDSGALTQSAFHRLWTPPSSIRICLRPVTGRPPASSLSVSFCARQGRCGQSDASPVGPASELVTPAGETGPVVDLGAVDVARSVLLLQRRLLATDAVVSSAVVVPELSDRTAEADAEVEPRAGRPQRQLELEPVVERGSGRAAAGRRHVRRRDVFARPPAVLADADEHHLLEVEVLHLDRSCEPVFALLVDDVLEGDAVGVEPLTEAAVVGRRLREMEGEARLLGRWLRRLSAGHMAQEARGPAGRHVRRLSHPTDLGRGERDVQ